MKLATRAAVVLFVGTISTVYAQHAEKDEQQKGQQGEKKGKPEASKDRNEGPARQRHGASQAEPQNRQPLPERRSQQAQPQGQSQERVQPQPQQRPDQQARAWQQQRGWLRQGGWQGNVSWERSRAQRWQTEHRSWTQRGGYGGSYIPQDRFNLSFGSRHSFRLRGRPAIYLGYPRFEYSGFSFLMVDPWPEYWSDNWYVSEDVYVDYDDGYYLYNRRYPQVRLAITITL